MDTSTLDFNTLTLLVAIVGSTLMIVTLMVRQSNRHEDSDPHPDDPEPRRSAARRLAAFALVADDARLAERGLWLNSGSG